MNKEIIKGSILIAEFEKGENISFLDDFYKSGAGIKIKGSLYPYNKLEYYTSWEWIMPACKKFNYLSDDGIIKNSDEYEKLCDELDDEITRYYDTKTVFPVLVKCIEWFNKNNVLQSAPSAQ